MRGKRRPVFRCDKITMEVLSRYSEVNVAADLLGISRKGALHACQERHVGYRNYVLRYADDYDPNESFEGKRVRPLTVRDAETGETHSFYNPNEAANALYMSSCAIGQALKSGKPAFGRYTVTYAR